MYNSDLMEYSKTHNIEKTEEMKNPQIYDSKPVWPSPKSPSTYIHFEEGLKYIPKNICSTSTNTPTRRFSLNYMEESETVPHNLSCPESFFQYSDTPKSKSVNKLFKMDKRHFSDSISKKTNALQIGSKRDRYSSDLAFDQNTRSSKSTDNFQEEIYKYSSRRTSRKRRNSSDSSDELFGALRNHGDSFEPCSTSFSSNSSFSESLNSSDTGTLKLKDDLRNYKTKPRLFTSTPDYGRHGLSHSTSYTGPRNFENLSWCEKIRQSSKSFHASLLDTPPSARSRERLFKRKKVASDPYPKEVVEKYRTLSKSSPWEYSEWKKNFITKCSSLRNSYVDSHCHIDFLFNRLPFNGTFKRYILENADIFPANYAGCIAVFCEPKSFTPEGGLWKDLENEDNIWLAMGCHPKKALDFDFRAEEGLRECIKHPKVVALGEIGLDYSGKFIEYRDIQKKVFVCQIKMALAAKKPLVIHCRDAQEDCLSILKKYVPVDYKIHCHCFTKSFSYAREWLSYFPNLFIGLTPLVTYSSAVDVHDTARNIPLDRLLLETDAPYFVPRCVPKGEMKCSHPGFAVAVALEVAKLQKTPVDIVLKHCLKNTKRMYGI